MRLNRLSAPLLLLACVISGCGPYSGPSQGGPLTRGSAAPPIVAAEWLNGAPQTDGRVVVLDVFASWCGPCRRAAPGLVQTYQQYESRGVAFVGLTTEPVGRRDQVQQFLDDLDIRWPVGLGAAETCSAFGVRGFPTLFVIARDGRVLWCDDMPGSLDSAIEEALKGTDEG
jgi:thiol-disulfide isomerase/thioredoxin